MKIVISDDYQDCVRHLDCFARLTGHTVDVHTNTLDSVDALAERFADAEAIVMIRERTRFDAALLERLPRLRLLSQTAAGIAHVDVDACNRLGIAVATGRGSPIAAAELSWALVLAGMRHLPQEVAAMRAGRWQTRLGTAVNGRTLGIWGYGKIGALMARYASAFDMRVLVWGREGSQQRARADGLSVADSHEQLLAESDVLSLHMRLADDNRGLITATDLARMKPDALLVNTARAELIAPGALEAALDAGRPGRAALDVYTQEPLREHPLLERDNVICTPHLGYVEKDSYELYLGDAFDNVVAFAEGRPSGIVNPEVLGKR